jgi:hypothetical protein
MLGYVLYTTCALSIEKYGILFPLLWNSQQYFFRGHRALDPTAHLEDQVPVSPSVTVDPSHAAINRVPFSLLLRLVGLRWRYSSVSSKGNYSDSLTN